MAGGGGGGGGALREGGGEVGGLEGRRRGSPVNHPGGLETLQAAGGRRLSGRRSHKRGNVCFFVKFSECAEERRPNVAVSVTGQVQELRDGFQCLDSLTSD